MCRMLPFIVSAKLNDEDLDLGMVEPDEFSLKDLWNLAFNVAFGFDIHSNETLRVECTLPWSNEKRAIDTDADLMETFLLFDQQSICKIDFRMELLPTGIEPPPQAVMHLGDLIFADGDANTDGLNMDENDNAGDANSDKDICNSNDNENHEPQNEIVDVDISEDDLSNVASEDGEVGDDKHSETDSDNQERRRGVHITGRPFAVRPGGIIDLQQGQLFNDVHHFRGVLRDFTIQEGFALTRVKNDKERVIVKCKDEGCSWRVYASPTPDKVTYKIKIYNGEHSCQKINKNVEANSGWIAKKYGPLIRSNPDIKISVLATDLREKFGLAILTWTLYRAKRKALESSGEDHKAAYKKLYKTLPILTFMEEYRRKIMRRIQKRHDQCIKWETILPPVIHKRLEVIKKEARYIIPIWAGEDEYEVKDISRHYIVKLNSQQCECGLWQVSGLPCKHVVACINAWRKDLNDCVHNYLKKEAYLKTYSFMIHPIPAESTWPDVEVDDNVLPPVKKRLPGRPKLARRREMDEQQRDRRSDGLKCGLCREFGHNRRSCSRNPDNMGKRKTSQRATTSSILATTVNKMRRIEGASGSSSNAVGSIDSQEMSMTTLENSTAGGSQLLYGSSTQNLISTTSQPPQAVETLQMPINQLQHIGGTQSLAISGSSTQQTTEWAAF
ncbi:hypothetical protein EZV62_006457 [Acer yangbiense]|uniref:SWIM-type domain-containing protein n=1 Tax=Acer yangbiense TaxID=1000413 RepID=A0A5C7I962_9ROSI|nr:hypothetical protein EZV62_006457 [Acer yangbiense]